MTKNENEVKDFTKKRSRIPFQIDNDRFEAAAAIPAGTLVQFVVKFSDLQNMTVDKKVSVLSEVLEMVLTKESYSRLQERLTDPDEPVDLDQLNEIIVWLLGEYGLRPTQQSSPSQVGLPIPEHGMNSTGDAFSVVSTLNPSPVPSS